MLEFESSQVSQPLVQLKIAHTFVTKSSQNAGFLTFIGLSPGSGKAQLQRKVSGHVRQYSRFRETSSGDLFRSVLIGRGDSYFEDFWRRLLIAPDKTDQGEITIGARRSFGDCLAGYLSGCTTGKLTSNVAKTLAVQCLMSLPRSCHASACSIRPRVSGSAKAARKNTP